MIAEGLSGYVWEVFGQSHYIAPFLVLLLCGLGLPLPEEVTLIGAGLLYYRGEVEFLPIVAVCSAAILIGDTVPYWVGRRWGLRALRVRPIRRLVHPERLRRLERRYREHGNWATFVCRFLPGFRLPGYFLAGTMGMRYPRFLLLDALGVVISVPLSIWLGMLFGDSIEQLQRANRNTHLILAFVALALVLVIVVRSRILRAERLDREPEKASRDNF